MVSYKDNEGIKSLFNGDEPYITQHMSAKDRNDYNQFRKGKNEKKALQGPPPPQVLGGYGMGFGQQQHNPYMPQMPMARQPNNYNYGPPPTQYYQ